MMFHLKKIANVSVTRFYWTERSIVLGVRNDRENVLASVDKKVCPFERKDEGCDGWSIVHECFMAPNYPRNMIDGRLALHSPALMAGPWPVFVRTCDYTASCPACTCPCGVVAPGVVHKYAAIWQ